MLIPRVDAVIPVDNGPKTIESAVASVQAQTVRDIRILVVNDGSTDTTKPIVERPAAADARVVLPDMANGGIVDALNAGLAALSAMRRRAGRTDIVFRKSTRREYQEARSIENVVCLGSRGQHAAPSHRFGTFLFPFQSVAWPTWQHQPASGKEPR